MAGTSSLATAEELTKLTRNPLETLCAKFGVDRALSGKPKGTLVVVDMTPHERKEYRELMAHRHLGFSADQLKEWTKHCPLDLAHSRPLRPDPNAAGPGLFVARFSRRENA